MKRVQSLDILRGIGMLFIVTMHAFQKVGWPVIQEVLDNLPEYEWYVLVPFAIVVFLATWRGLFMLISGVVSMYGFQKAVQNGKSIHIVFLKRVMWSIILFIQGMAIQVFWGPYTGLYKIFIDSINPEAWWGNLRWSDAVEVIAIGIFVSSLLQYIIYLFSSIIRKKSRTSHNVEYWVSIGINLLLMIAVLVVQTYVVEAVLSNTEFTDIRQIKNGSVEDFGDRVRLLGLSLLVGEQQPLFPYLSATFLGNAFGIGLTHPNLNKSRFLLIGTLGATLILISSFCVGYFLEDFEIVTTIVPNQWYYLAGLGVQSWVFMLFLRVFDFSKRAEKRIKYTKIFRTAGILSLTIFSMQWLDYLPRRLLQEISLKWGEGNNFVGYNTLGLSNSIITAVTVLVFWLIVIYLWSKINFALSFDWIFDILQKLAFRQKIHWKDPMRSRDIIHNVEIVFIKPQKRKKL